MFPSTDKQAGTDSDDEPTQVIDKDVLGSSAGEQKADMSRHKLAAIDEDAQTQVIDDDNCGTGEKVVAVTAQQHDDKTSAGSTELNTDDLCTQVFVTDVQTASDVTGRNTLKPVDLDDDFPTQVLEEISEKAESLTDEATKMGKGRGRVKKKGKLGSRKAADEDLDGLATQVFDSFVPPAPPSGKTVPVQSSKDVDGGVDKSEADLALGGRRAKRGRSLKRLNTETTSANQATVSAMTDPSTKPERDDLATQVFEDEDLTGSVAAVPSAASCPDNVATQVFDDVSTSTNTTGLHGRQGGIADSSGGHVGLKSGTNVEDHETQVLDVVDPATDWTSSRGTKRNSAAAKASMKTYSRAAGRRAKKSAGRTQLDSGDEVDFPADHMDDMATQVFATEPDDKLSEIGNIGASGSDDAERSQKSSGKPGSNSKSESGEEMQAEHEEKDLVEETSRRLSSRANRGKRRGRQSSLSTVPEDTAADKPRAARSQGRGSKQTNLPVEDGTSEPSSDVHSLSDDIVNPTESKLSPSTESEDTEPVKTRPARSQGRGSKQINLPVEHGASEPSSSDVHSLSDDIMNPTGSKLSSSTESEDTEVLKTRPARSQAKRAKEKNALVPDDHSVQPSNVDTIHRDDSEVSGKPAAGLRNKTSRLRRSAQQRLVAAEPTTSDTVGAGRQIGKPVTVRESADETPAKPARRSHKLYTAKGSQTFLTFYSHLIIILILFVIMPLFSVILILFYSFDLSICYTQ